MFSKHRKAIRKNKELDKILNSDKQKYYIERNYAEIRLFKYLVFLRKNKVNINKILDDYISKNENL